LTLTLAVTALVVSGCGKSGKTTTTAAATTPPTTSSAASTATSAELPPGTTVKVATGTPLTRVQLIAKGDTICARANRLVDTVNVTSKNEALAGFGRALVYEAAEEKELVKLVPPASMAQDWGTIVNDFHRYVEYAEAASREAKAKNVKAIVALIKPAEALHERLNALAARDGFKYCSTIK
jgi:hypothetical protein